MKNNNKTQQNTTIHNKTQQFTTKGKVPPLKGAEGDVHSRIENNK
jgi:hypothetical protein